MSELLHALNNYLALLVIVAVFAWLWKAARS